MKQYRAPCLTRRGLLALAIGAAGSSVLSACGRATSPVPVAPASPTAQSSTPQSDSNVVVARPDSVGNWRDAASPPNIPWAHTATLLVSGQVLVVGNSTLIYDPSGDRWRELADAGPVPPGHTATRLANGTVLAAGGTISRAITNSAWLFAPDRETWQAAPPMRVARINHRAVGLADGQVLVIGGDAPPVGEPRTVSAERFDPATGTWHEAGTPALTAGTGTRLPDGMALITGLNAGLDYASPPEAFSLLVQRYDSASNDWRAGASLASGRQGHTATLLPNGQVLIAGGMPIAPSGVQSLPLATTARYDPQADRWYPAAPLRIARWGHTATALSDGRVLLVGGKADPGLQFRVDLPSGGSFTVRGTVNVAEIYDPVADRWRDAGTTHPAFYQESTTTLLTHGEVLLVGGEDDQQLPTLAQRYAPA